MSTPVLLIDNPEENIVRLILNRPDQKNALSASLRGAISQAMRTASEDDSVKAVLLQSTGDVFCAGFDLKELSEGHTEQIFAEARVYHHSVYTCSKPVVAVIQGPAYAGGMDLAAMCDIRVGSSGAVFAQPQVKMGVPASFELMKTLLPEALARELCLTGRKLNAEEALEKGFLNRIVADSELHEVALQTVRELATVPAGINMKAVIVRNQPLLFAP
ncbi:MAG: enoyl-CoA hydratase/isomerase family protein [Gammaproteobacteria bacterium]|nr:enoyl-CoA hydratase/isomerase family protein [Gammaproteobacteria bacterium]